VIASGTVSNFSSTGAAGERFRVQILGTDGLVKAQEFVTPASDGKWAMTTATSALALGDYTIKAEILDVAGNVVKVGEHALKVVDKTLTAKPDKATVQEDITLTVEGDLIRGASNGDGTDIDTNEGFATLKIVKIKAGNGTFQSVGTEVEINGEFGKLKIGDDGKYTYTLNNNDAKVQALTSGGAPGIDEFTYEVTNALGQTSSTTFKVNVNGLDDAAQILLPSGVKQKVEMSSGSTLNLSESIQVIDVDAGQAELDVLTAGSEFVGSFSTFEIDPVSVGTHGWTFKKSAGVTGSETINRHDLYTLNSKDGSASLTFDFVVNATGTATTQEFHTSTVQGLKIEAAGSSTTDKVVLHGSQLEFDFTDPTTNTDSIERIDITGTGNNTIKLSLASLTQADADRVSGVHRLIIDGDSTDIVQLNNTLGTAASHVTPTLVGGYNSYLIDPSHELLVKSSISNVTFI
jgi:VCBS repeat-containing protein